MGKKLDALLGRGFKISKFKATVNLAISRVAVLRNQHQGRCSVARSDVLQFLNLRHHEAALSRVAHVVKEQNMLDVYTMIEIYCNMLIQRASLLKNTKECPEELKEAISSLIYACSICDEFPELHEIRAIFSSRFGKEFVDRVVQLRENGGVNPKMIQELSTRMPSTESRLKVLKEIALENSIVLQIEEPDSVQSEVKNEAENGLDDSEPILVGKSDVGMLDGSSDSVKLRRKYSSLDSPQSSMMIEDEEMVGLGEEREKLKNWLLSNSGGNEIVSISGMAGLGKTTLAKNVFNHLTKEYHHFDEWAAITVSQAYRKEDLLIKIILQTSHYKTKEFGRNSFDDKTEKLRRMSFDELELLLNQSLKKKRYLIFLDDIWDISAWHTLKRSFPDSAVGSRILFTTRFSDVATRVVNNHDDDRKVLHLQPLPPNMTLELLNRKVFGKGSCPPRLNEVRDQIASKCKGLPLAAVMVAGILKGDNRLSSWEEVSNSFNSHLIDTSRGVLELSYNKLPDHLKPCFLYFGLFPEDELIRSEKLIRLWIAEGFIPITESKILEHLARDYLEDLMSRNLVTVAKRGSTGGLRACSMHDLVRSFCLDQSEKESFFHIINPENNHAIGTFVDEYITGERKRRLSVQFVIPSSINWSTSFGPSVHSLLWFPGRIYWEFGLPSTYDGFRFIGVLHLMSLSFGKSVPFPSSIYSLTQLRYLAIRGSFHTLHRISDLLNLETLILRSESESGPFEFRFPHTILEMKKLRHIETIGTDFTLEDISFSTLLLNLQNLQTISSLQMKYEDCIGEIMRKVKNALLKKLKLKLMDERRDSSNLGNESLILDFLCDLESIKIDCFGRIGIVDIVFPENIKKVSLSSIGLPWKKIDVVATLPNLQVLKLHFGAFEGEEWIVQDGTFQKLTVLSLVCLDFERWRVSDDCDDDCCFPLLKQLELVYCDQLCEIPSGLGSDGELKMIKVQECNLVKESIEELVKDQKELANDETSVVPLMDYRYDIVNRYMKYLRSSQEGSSQDVL